MQTRNRVAHMVLTNTEAKQQTKSSLPSAVESALDIIQSTHRLPE